ncbi:MAG: helix-turn-helix transcriptional regulator [Desulfuromonadaceae bacterium]|nr:helix-turn-helix transcriptional regulator [Desulfuromonadaceae bacterium]MDD2847155.1 helix-turn-helix transcriptional regulator [Desulfuromonadaceae bacterium]MDD4130099.1 helix-turn-helix transcriptional regulator [Desulfuromonadaceae bacterium]
MYRATGKYDPQVIIGSDEIPDQFLFFELNKDVVTEENIDLKSPHRHSYQEIIWVRQGSAEQLLDGEIVTYPSHTLLIVPKGRIHRFVPSRDCLGCVIRFKDEFLLNQSHLLFSQFSGHTALHLSDEQPAGIEAYFSLMSSECKRADPYHLQALRYLLAAFIAKLEELRLQYSRVVPQDFTLTLCIWNRFNTLIEQKFKSEHAVSFYASELGLSPRRLGDVVKLYTGEYTSDVIDGRLIVEAKRLLLFSNLTIKEIAFELGFEEHSYFTKVFKKLTGKTPSDFKPISSSAQNYQL